MEQFFDDLEALADSGGGMIKIGSTRLEIDEMEAEAAAFYLSMMETPQIAKAMRDITYFKDVIQMGMEEMGYEGYNYESYHESKNDKEEVETIETDEVETTETDEISNAMKVYARVLNKIK